MKKVAIVDGFSAGKFMAKELYDKGCYLLHIASKSDLHSYYYKGFDYSIYKEHYVYYNIVDTVNFLKEQGVEFIIAGSESGVSLADKLNSHFELNYKNDFIKTSARRNKYEMIDTLRKYGIPAAEQGKFSDWHTAEQWIRTFSNFPVVLKPLESAGSDGVYICENERSAKEAFYKILGKSNKLNLCNNHVLIQEFLKGTEYVVNMVSLNSNPLVTEVVKYKKRRLDTGSIIYDIDDIIDSSYPEYNVLVEYTKKVVLTLGIFNGPSHAEVMLTPDGPKLVEIAARMDGILRPAIAKLTTGLGQISASAMSIVEPENFNKAIQIEDYILINHSYNVCLINHRLGIFTVNSFMEELKKLPSFCEVVFYVDEGDEIEVTKDVFSQPGTVYLVHHDKDIIKQDYEKIRKIEESGGYLKNI
ncbi:ATP-grasp domain-containing protein [Photorhabdus sp. SF281]|uniref:ATP-grasp domain-containing protein n=1 Tax=Photorhabdus sp. SF281 TaxID=3459527 RepID=UPI004044F615